MRGSLHFAHAAPDLVTVQRSGQSRDGNNCLIRARLEWFTGFGQAHGQRWRTVLKHYWRNHNKCREDNRQSGGTFHVVALAQAKRAWELRHDQDTHGASVAIPRARFFTIQMTGVTSRPEYKKPRHFRRGFSVSQWGSA
ncbi:MAG: hypothetical protein AAFP16_19585 [Pseudomonadota bacterium]